MQTKFEKLLSLQTIVIVILSLSGAQLAFTISSQIPTLAMLSFILIFLAIASFVLVWVAFGKAKNIGIKSGSYLGAGLVGLLPVVLGLIVFVVTMVLTMGMLANGDVSEAEVTSIILGDPIVVMLTDVSVVLGYVFQIVYLGLVTLGLINIKEEMKKAKMDDQAAFDEVE